MEKVERNRFVIYNACHKEYARSSSSSSRYEVVHAYIALLTLCSEMIITARPILGTPILLDRILSSACQSATLEKRQSFR